jgi:hypothetical protein
MASGLAPREQAGHTNVPDPIVKARIAIQLAGNDNQQTEQKQAA